MTKTRWVSLGMAAVLAAGTVACSKAEEPNKETPGSGTAAPSGSADANKKFTVTAFKYFYGNPPPADGKGLQMINEKFNIDYKPNMVVQSDYLQKLSAIIASGDIPDIIAMEGPDSNFYKWAKQGAFLPLNDFIQQYPSFKLVPDNVLKTFSVGGKIYAFPGYYPLTYTLTPMIRQDWLDNLNLKMPTNYEELKQVAIAFTKNDPDKNGKHDTYGLAMSLNINPQYAMGAYWDLGAWYHKDAQGQLIPGFISEARKNHIQWMADLFKEGAISKDFALMNWAQANKEFYSGKAGIFIGTPRGMNQDYMKGLVDTNPNAKLEMIPAFQAPDGSQGFGSSNGYYGMIMLSAKLKDQPDKVKRILEMIDFGRKFYAADQRTKDNPDFDWINGIHGQGYVLEDGVVKKESAEKGLAPSVYLPETNPWAPSDAANEYSKTYKVPLLQEIAAKAEKMHAEQKHYMNPGASVFSETRASKGSELDKKLYEEQTRMIVGDKPVSDWDKMVKEYMDNGGAQIIKEVNDAMKAENVKGEWK
ncbi:extracellular solute-binding protein [Paenibacillus flagellatus]|uniref:ABC transporter substrate-binding protein n=1 Tax=Paenibacillus flagellatus TaxID=2211139 RepID=A0A2V5L3J1_9BACL|nr:extracellular solute-binding protein [Paenibacillus flagellatus]PYI57406.1 ABC transporter substrate-binding protein [Paenibacillus flagellatus]